MSSHQETEMVHFEGHPYQIISEQEVLMRLAEGTFNPSEDRRYWIEVLRLGYSRQDWLENLDTDKAQKVWNVPICLNYCRIGTLSAIHTRFEKSFNAKHLTVTELFQCGGLADVENTTKNQTHFQENVDFSYAQFHGDASFKKAVFAQELKMDSCFSQKTVDFDYAKFGGKVSFLRTRNTGRMQFQEAHFQQEADFSRTSFQSLTFEKATLEKKVWFDRASIQGRVIFQNTRFRDTLKMELAYLRSDLDFRGADIQDINTLNSRFEGIVTFSENLNTMRFRVANEPKKFRPIDYIAVIRGNASFANTFFARKTIFDFVHFQKEADFRNTYFAEQISFRDAKFYENADFTASYCATELDFTDSVFQKDLRLDNANINRKLNLSNSVFQCGISFSQAVIDVMVVERKQIEDKMIYQGTLPGHEKSVHFGKLRSEFLILKESYHQLGRYDDEDWCYHMFKQYLRKDTIRSAYRSLKGATVSMNQAERYEKEGFRHPLMDVPKEEFQNRFGAGSEKFMPSQPKTRTTGTSRIVALWRVLIKTFEKVFVDWGTGYGTHPFRIGFLTLAIVLGYAVMYWGAHETAVNLSSLGEQSVPVVFEGREFNLTGPEMKGAKAPHFGDFFIFSMMMFVAGGMESAHPNSASWMKYVCMSESFFGVFIMALFVGCYIRKVLR